MADLGTVNILIDIKGQPLVKELATDFDRVTVSEKKMSDATAKVMADFRRMKSIMQMVKTETDGAANSFQRFSAKELQQTAQRMQGFESVLANTRRGMGQMGMATQQVGYQVGDFLVQIQSGTNWMVAFGQQATQLVGILPSFAGKLGMSVSSLIGISTGLGIAIPLVTAIGAAFMRTSDSAKKSAESVDAYSEALKGLQNSIKDTQLSLDKLSFGTEDPVIAAAKKAQAEAEAQLQLARANQRRIGNALAPTTEQSAALREAVINWTNISGILRELEAKQAALAEAQRMLNGGLSVAGGLQRAAVQDKQEELRAAKDYEQSLVRAYGYYAKTRVEADKIAAANAKANESSYADAQFAKQAAIIAFYKEQEEAENKAGEKAEYLRQVFHMLAGETSSISTGIKPLPEILDKAAIAAYKLASAMADTRTAASAVLSSMIQVDAARLRKQGQVQAAAAGFVGMPELDIVGNRAAVNAARGTILEFNNAPDTGGAKTDPLAELQKQIALQEELNGKTEAEQKVRQALGDSFSKYSVTVIKGLEDQIQKQMDLEAAVSSQQQIFDTVKTSMEDAFMGMVDGTMTAKDAFKSMAAAIIKELYKVLVVQQLVGSFNASTGTGSGIVGAIVGGLSGFFGGGRANGGPISAGVPYMVGERGPEMIIPKSSGMVLTNGQTKAALGGESYTVQNNITVTGSDSAMVRQEITKMIPQITDATKAAVVDAKLRGGSYGKAFR